jgi:UDP-glucuronate 4-epimerase
MRRDFTYLDDVIEGVVRVLDKIPQPNPDWSSYDSNPGTSYAPYKIYNIRNNKPVELTQFIEILENYLGITAVLGKSIIFDTNKQEK